MNLLGNAPDLEWSTSRDLQGFVGAPGTCRSRSSWHGMAVSADVDAASRQAADLREKSYHSSGSMMPIDRFTEWFAGRSGRHELAVRRQKPVSPCLPRVHRGDLLWGRVVTYIDSKAVHSRMELHAFVRMLSSLLKLRRGGYKTSIGR